ncbi:MAG: DUF6470 family protein [Oscillospiraceae bacterium]|jgi:hypothetical protein|nr:DUF6470 family protein [Oscillospiraceae bacterium]
MSVISKIIIEQQFAQIGVRMTPAHMKISTQRPELKITQEDPKMKIDWKLPNFQVNWDQVFNESGLKRTDVLSDDFAKAGSAASAAATGEISSDGDYVMNASRKGPRIAQIAKRHVKTRSSVDTNLGLMPKHSPVVKWDTGYMHIDWNHHSIKIEWEGEYMPEMVLDPPYSIEVYLREKPFFEITIEDNRPLPYEAGQRIDEKV